MKRTKRSIRRRGQEGDEEEEDVEAKKGTKKRRKMKRIQKSRRATQHRIEPSKYIFSIYKKCRLSLPGLFWCSDKKTRALRHLQSPRPFAIFQLCPLPCPAWLEQKLEAEQIYWSQKQHQAVQEPEAQLCRRQSGSLDLDIWRTSSWAAPYQSGGVRKREGGDGLVMAGFGTDINNTEFVVTYVSFCPVLKLWSRSIVLPYAFSFQFLFWSFPKKNVPGSYLTRWRWRRITGSSGGPSASRGWSGASKSPPSAAAKRLFDWRSDRQELRASDLLLQHLVASNNNCYLFPVAIRMIDV